MLRAGIGLLALLIGVFIMVWVFATYTSSSMPAYKQATANANLIAGRSPSNVVGQQGTPVLADSKYSAVEQNGKLSGVQVTVMPATNGLYQYYGLAVGDVVKEIGPFKVGEDTLTDFDTTRDWIQEGMQRQMKMVVERGGARITLPDDRNTPVPTPATGATGTAAAPAGSTPATPPTAEAKPQPQQTPAAAPPPPQQGKNGYGAAEDLRQQIQRSQNRGD